jgi:hypothetical protein
MEAGELTSCIRRDQAAIAVIPSFLNQSKQTHQAEATDRTCSWISANCNELTDLNDIREPYSGFAKAKLFGYSVTNTFIDRFYPAVHFERPLPHHQLERACQGLLKSLRRFEVLHLGEYHF